MRLLTRLAAIAAALLAVGSAPLYAQDAFEPYAEIEARGVHSDRAVVDGDSIEASGAGASLDTGFVWRGGRTAVQFDLGAEIFEFSDDDRETRTSLRVVGEVSREIVPDVTLSLAAGHWDDITTLEARRTDQDAVALALAYENRPHRLRTSAQYRAREYEAATPSTGSGMRYDADYTYRLGSWHWARLDLRAEDIDSDDSRRGYERYTARASYSVPLDDAKRWRLRPQIEWQNWEYDERQVRDGSGMALRKDSYFAPEIGLAYGKLSGVKARLRAAYQFRTSNDARYRADAPYFDLRIGYRF